MAMNIHIRSLYRAKNMAEVVTATSVEDPEDGDELPDELAHSGGDSRSVSWKEKYGPSSNPFKDLVQEALCSR